MLEFGVCGVPLLTFSLRVYPSGGVHWVYDVPGWFVDIDGNVNVINDSDCDQEQCGNASELNTDVSEQTDSDCADKCEDASELTTDVSESEECEYASEEDLAHLFGYDLSSTYFCDYGDNGFYIV